MGRAMLNIIMVFAQLERETTAERVRDNYFQRAKLGSWPGGPAPYGFSIQKLLAADGRPASALLLNEHAAVVERIFSAYAQPEATLGSVARSLNADKIPGPKRPTWDNVTLSRILHNPVYVMADEDVYLFYQGKGLLFSNQLDEFDGLHGGMITGKRDRNAGKYQDLRAQHFSLALHYGLVPSSLWLQCQYKLEANRQLGGSGRGKHTWLSGLLKCARCGYSVKVNRDGSKFYLLCTCCLPYLFHSKRIVIQRNLILHGTGYSVKSLLHIAVQAALFMFRNLKSISSLNQHFTLSRLIESQQQFENGTFACAGSSRQRHLFSGIHLEA